MNQKNPPSARDSKTAEARGITPLPFVSIVVPCLNEAQYIGACLDSIAACDFPQDCYELLIVDGMSTDGTREIVAPRAERDAHVRLIDNPARIVPAAMNIGIAEARGDVIVRLDAHCLYPPDYVSKLVEWLGKSEADNVGGICRTLPANGSAKARAIATALSHPFGVGNSYFRIGTREARWVDTVPFGCYRRDTFTRIGLFDEELVRNQDDELNARLIRHGGRILLVPDVTTDYFARDTIGKLWRMYFQYGCFKPLAAKKVGRVMTVRQLVPAAFVSMLVAGLLLAGPLPAARLALASLLAVYAAADTVSAASAAWREGPACVLWLAVAFPVVHVAYGLGFLKGLPGLTRPTRRTPAAIAVATSR